MPMHKIKIYINGTVILAINKYLIASIQVGGDICGKKK